MSEVAPSAEKDAPGYVCSQCGEPVNAEGFDANRLWHGNRATRPTSPGVDQ